MRCELARHEWAPQRQTSTDALPFCTMTRLPAQQDSSTARGGSCAHDAPVMPRSNVQRRPALLRLSTSGRIGWVQMSGNRDSANRYVRPLSHRTAQASNVQRKAWLVRLSVGVRIDGRAPPRQRPQAAAGAGRADPAAGSGAEGARAPPGWHLHSLRLLRVRRGRASIRTSSRGGTLVRSYTRHGSTMHETPTTEGSGIRRAGRLHPGSALGNHRMVQRTIPAQQQPVRPWSQRTVPAQQQPVRPWSQADHQQPSKRSLLGRDVSFKPTMCVP